jgi:hypothetical protein
MAHYAFLDEDNIVTEVIVGRDEFEEVDGITDWEKAYAEVRGQKCVRTSYNGNIRYNYAGIGYTYDEDADAFIAPRPQCGHKELLLNDKFRWNCQRCELDAKALRDEA